MKLVLVSLILTFACLPKALRGVPKRPLDKVVELVGIPYMHCDHKCWSGRASAAMALTALLKEIVTLPEIRSKLHQEEDDIETFGGLFSKLGLDSYAWTHDFDLELMKRLLEEGRPLLLQGFFDTSSRVYYEKEEGGGGRIPKNAVLIYGFGQWGFFVHDPFGQWLGKKELGYKRDVPPDQKVFAGKDSLWLFRSLRVLLEDSCLTTLAWSESLTPEDIVNTFRNRAVHPAEKHLVPLLPLPYKEATE